MSPMNCYAVDDIIILASQGYDSWGEPASGEMISVKGYVEWKTQLVRNRRGTTGGVKTPEECVSTCVVYFQKRRLMRALGRGLTLEDRIIIDQGGVEEYYSGMPENSLDRAIVDIRQPKDFSHPHYEVYLA